MASFSVQTIKFEFKWTNQETRPHYHPPTPAVGCSADGTARTIASGSVRPHCERYRRSNQMVGLSPARHATSSKAGGSAIGAGATASEFAAYFISYYATHSQLAEEGVVARWIQMKMYITCLNHKAISNNTMQM
jgi:hypothetical protein